MSPSTYQSDNSELLPSHGGNRARAICATPFHNTTKCVCHWNPNFAAYLAKKRAEGKHYNVALSHATKKLVRLIFAMEKSKQPYSQLAA